MAKCDYCGSTIIFGGKQTGALRFCNDRCLQGGAFLAVSQQVPDNIVQQAVWSVHQGSCPECRGPGPVDVHVSHRVWSALLLTSWRSQPRVSCRRCGIKSQVSDAAFSLFFGWWGFPWGIIMTPVQIGRDIVALTCGPDPTKPSAELHRMVRMNIAASPATQQGTRPDA